MRLSNRSTGDNSADITKTRHERTAETSLAWKRLTHADTDNLIEECRNSTNTLELPRILEELERLVLSGYKPAISKIEPLIKRLHDLHLGRRAAELMNVLRLAGVTSRRAYYFAIASAQRAGAHLLVAPLVRALADDHGDRPCSWSSSLLKMGNDHTRTKLLSTHILLQTATGKPGTHTCLVPLQTTSQRGP